MSSKLLPGFIGLACFMFFVGCASTPTIDPTKTNTLTIINSAPFDANAEVTDAVREKCGLEKRVPRATYDVVRKKDLYDQVLLAEDGSIVKNGSVLKLKITDAKGYGGGPWSGHKYLWVEGKLSKGGKVIGTFTVLRSSLLGGPFSGLRKKTCGLFARSAAKVADDIGEWIAAPTINAKLGDVEKKPAVQKQSRRGKKEEGDEEDVEE